MRHGLCKLGTALLVFASLSACDPKPQADIKPLAERPIKLEVRTLTTEGMLLHAAREARDALADMGNVTEPVTVEFYSQDDGAGLFALTWSPESVSRTNWERLDDWEVLSGAQEGRFLTVAGSTPVAAFCGDGIKSRMFGPSGTNPGYFEGFCRLLTSNSLPWAEYEGAGA